MEKVEVLQLFADKICDLLCIDKMSRSVAIAYFTPWNWREYSNFYRYKESIEQKANYKIGFCDPLRLLNLLFSEIEKKDIYEKTCQYLVNSRRGRNAITTLLLLERELKIDRKIVTQIREEIILKRYFNKASFTDYTQSLISSLMVSCLNDGVYDEHEMNVNKFLVKEYKTMCPRFLFNSFDLSFELAKIEMSPIQLYTLKNIMGSAVKADRKVNQKEVRTFHKIMRTIGVKKGAKVDHERVIPFCALKVLMSDDKLTNREKDWFRCNIASDKMISSAEEAFWFLNMLVNKFDVFKNNKIFFKEFWNTDKANYESYSLLFLVWLKNHRQVSPGVYREFVSFLDIETGQSFKGSLKKLAERKVIKEELYMLLNIITNESLSVFEVNELLNHESIERIFYSFKNSKSKLQYFAIVQSLVTDGKIDSVEYSTLWKIFETIQLDSSELEKVLYDYSILKLKEFNYDAYFTYLGLQRSI